MDEPVLPDYAGACISNIVPALLDGRSSRRRGCPPPARRRRPGRAARARRPRLGAAPGRAATSPRRWRRWPAGRSPPGARPPRPPRSPRSPPGCTPGEHGVVGYRIDVDGEVLNVLRWTTPAGDARQRHPARADPARRAVLRPAPADRDPGRVRQLRLHAGPPRRRPLPRLPHAVDAGRPRSAACSGPASRSSTPTTTASTRSPTSTASASTTTPSSPSVDRLVADMLAELPPGAALVVTADHGQVDVGDNIVRARTPRSWPTWPFQSGEGRFRWLHARPGRGRRPARGGRRAPRRHRLGASPGTRSIDEGWFGPSGSPTPPAAPRRRRPGGPRAVAFLDPADTGPYQLIGRHGSLTPAEMLVPLLVGEN